MLTKEGQISRNKKMDVEIESGAALQVHDDHCVFCFTQISQVPARTVPAPLLRNPLGRDQDTAATDMGNDNIDWKFLPLDVDPGAPDIDILNDDHDKDKTLSSGFPNEPKLFSTLCSIFKLNPTTFPVDILELGAKNELKWELPICKPCLNGPIKEIIELHEKIVQLTNSLDHLKLQIKIRSLIAHNDKEESKVVLDNNESESFVRLWHGICADFLPRIKLSNVGDGAAGIGQKRSQPCLNSDLLPSSKVPNRRRSKRNINAQYTHDFDDNTALTLTSTECLYNYNNPSLIKKEPSDEFILPNIIRRNSSRTEPFNSAASENSKLITKTKHGSTVKTRRRKQCFNVIADGSDLDDELNLKKKRTSNNDEDPDFEPESMSLNKQLESSFLVQKDDSDSNCDGKTDMEDTDDLFETAPAKSRRVWFSRTDEEGNLWVKEYKMERRKEGVWYCSWCDKTIHDKYSSIRHLWRCHAQYKFKHRPRLVDGKTWIGEVEVLHLQEFDVWSCGICDFKNSQKSGVIKHVQIDHYQENPEFRPGTSNHKKRSETKKKPTNQEHEESVSGRAKVENPNLVQLLTENELDSSNAITGIDATKEIISFSKVKLDMDGTEIFQCGKCFKGILKWSLVLQHIKNRHKAIVDPISIEQTKPSPSFLCGQCGQCFIKKFQLTKHELSHAERIYKCKEEGCDKTYKYADHLRMHTEKIHLKIRNHICPICEFAFYSKNDLTNHERTHTKENPFACKNCGKRFRYTSSQGRHEAKCNGTQENVTTGSNQDFESDIDLVGIGTGTSSSLDYLTPMFNSSSVDFYTTTAVVSNYGSSSKY